MTERELLELAAKAAGLQLRWFSHLRHNGEDVWPKVAHLGNVVWDPLTDDGDALRLAVRLGMNVHVIRDDGTFVSRYEHEPVIAEKRGADPCAATRRAIVRAAAEIGRSMT